MRKWAFLLVFFALSCAFGGFALNSGERNTPDEMAQRSEPDELGSYVVLLEDIDHEQVLSAFASRYPEEYQLYITIKNSETIPDPEEYEDSENK